MDELDELLARAAAARDTGRLLARTSESSSVDGDELVEDLVRPAQPFPPPRLHWSSLRSMSRSPAHFRAAVEGGFTATASMRMGLACHSLILGGDPVVRFEGERRQGRAWTSFEEEHADAIVLTAPEHDRAFAIAQKVRTHPIAGPKLDGEHEVKLEWDWLGRACAGRVDVVGRDFLTEVKITANAEPTWFVRHATRLMHYHGQLRWYQEGARANRIDARELFVVAVEMRKPFAVTVFRLTDRTIEAGERCARAWMERFLVCEQADAWPEYAQGVVEMDVEEELIFGDDESEVA